MAVRSFATYMLTLVAGVEQGWSPPDGACSIEITMDTPTDVRIAVAAGGTADGQPYFQFNPDWWTEPSKEMDLSSEHMFYFRCAANNVLRFIVAIE